MTTLNDLVTRVKASIDPNRVGMLVCHNGIMRGTSRDGRPAVSLEIHCNWDQWNTILEEVRSRPGIEAVEAHLCTGVRKVGDDVLLVVVAGDIRENVFPALVDVVNRLKSEAVIKKENLAT